jgi:hypothetical protein
MDHTGVDLLLIVGSIALAVVLTAVERMCARKDGKK